jgi:hypothetical protein
MSSGASTVHQAVRDVASGILKGVSSPPTDLDALKPALNVTRIFSEDLPVSGELRRNDRAFDIVYSSTLSAEQRQFTIAHEMGHAIFELTGPNCPRSGQELERLCDMLATELVFPHETFRECLGKDLSLAKVFDLSRRFRASLSATAIRCAEYRSISVFEAERDRINWGSGMVRKGTARTMSLALRIPSSRPWPVRSAVAKRF